MSRQAQLLLIWAASSFIAVIAALQFTSAAFESETGTWVPVSNDSFYHASRILDASEPPYSIAQFDKKIHAPDGSWVTWPWAYDWSAAQLLRGYKKLNPSGDARAFLVHLPVYWLFVNAALLMGICVAAGLPVAWIAVVMLGFALSPLTMLLHGVGIIDHHYIEYTFVLLTTLTGLRWLNRPNRHSRAALLGITLGIAPAFHTGLFILQLPVLIVLGLLWMRKALPDKDSLLTLSSALIIATLLVLLPSGPFLDGQFQFAVLSWFHLYIAASCTLIIACLAKFTYSHIKLCLMIALGGLLLLPILNDALGGAAFLTADILLLDRIPEAQSPLSLAMQSGGLLDMLSYYSLLGPLVPLLLIIYLWKIWHTKNSSRLFLAVMIVFGLTLLLIQFRLHYFGSFAILLGWAVLANDNPTTSRWQPAKIAVFGSILVVVAGLPGIGQKMLVRYALGLDPAYQDTFSLLQDLGNECNLAPGIAFADNNFGHYISYHSDCSVIANNFLMTSLHEQKVAEMHRLMELSPEDFLSQAPDGTRYIFARLEKFFVLDSNGEPVFGNNEFLRDNNNRLFFELNTRSDLPARMRTIAELPLDESAGSTRARLLEILPAD